MLVQSASPAVLMPWMTLTLQYTCSESQNPHGITYHALKSWRDQATVYWDESAANTCLRDRKEKWERQAMETWQTCKGAKPSCKECLMKTSHDNRNSLLDQSTHTPIGSLLVLTWISSSLELNSVNMTFSPSETRVREMPKRPLATSCPFSGRVLYRQVRMIFTKLKDGCKGPRNLFRASFETWMMFAPASPMK